MPYATSHETWKSAVNMYVDDAHFSSDVDESSMYLADLGAPVAPNAAGIIAAQSLAATGYFSTFAGAYLNAIQPAPLGKYGRNVTLVASGASTSNIRIDGRDYLGQPMSEAFTLTGTTPVAGKKAFAHIEGMAITIVTAGTTVNVGWGDVLGVPYKSLSMICGYEAGVPAAGTVVNPVVTAQTLTTGDPRGTYDPTAVCDGIKKIELLVRVDKTNLYGEPHFRG